MPISGHGEIIKMTTVIINDLAVEAVAGDGLLDLARRNRAHIGFVCDGNGLVYDLRM